MRDKNLTPLALDAQIAKAVAAKEPKRLVLTEAVFVNPNLQYVLRLGPLPSKLLDRKALALVSYWVPDEALGFYLREEIREKLDQYDLKDRLQLEILLFGRKDLVLNWLFLNESMSSRDLFGTWIEHGVLAFNELKFHKRRLRDPVEPVYRRGYKDKGSRRPETAWLPSFDYSWTELQNEKERIDDLYQAYLSQVLEILKNPQMSENFKFPRPKLELAE